LHQLKNKKWKLPEGNIFKLVTQEFLIYVQTNLIRASLLKTFSFQYKALSEDWQFILFVARHTKFYGINKVVVRYRKHTLSLSAQNRRKEHYYLWCRSNVLMFLEAYRFPENTKEEKRIIANRIQFDLLDYAYQPRAKYPDVIQIWKEVKTSLPVSKSVILFIQILYLRARLFAKKILLNK
jgi:hypothetical protein